MHLTGATGPVRFFTRLLSFADDIHNGDLETLFLGALEHLSFVIGREEAANKDFHLNYAANHVFVNIANPDTVISPNKLESELRLILEKNWTKLIRLSVNIVEFKVSCRLAQDSETISLRYVATNPTGFVIDAHLYYEATSGFPGDDIVFRSVGDLHGPWDGQSIQTPYPVTQKFEKERAEARTASDTLYVYDWPILFQSAAEKQWLESLHGPHADSLSNNIDGNSPFKLPEELIKFKELVVCAACDCSGTCTPLEKFNAKDIENGRLCPIEREPGLNSAGMVAWLVTIKTPEYPNGRDFVLISNDITHKAGSFGTKEDYYFYKVCATKDFDY